MKKRTWGGGGNGRGQEREKWRLLWEGGKKGGGSAKRTKMR